jgi:ATP synthase F1 gamma subunit
MQKEIRLNDEYDQINSLDDIVVTFEEMAAMTTRKLRNSVLQQRVFLKGLNEAYGYTTYAYDVYKSTVLTKLRNKTSNTNTTLYICLTANVGLFGDIIKDTFDLFTARVMKESEKHPDIEVAIVGRIGRKFAEEAPVPFSYKFFELQDIAPSKESVDNLLSYVSGFDNVVVFHGVFESILLQVPFQTHLLGEMDAIKKELSQERHTANFIFEPDVVEINNYFENQVKLLLFNQLINEYNLSKFASRMVNLDAASQKIQSRKKGIRKELNRLKHKKMNSALLLNFARASAWRGLSRV